MWHQPQPPGELSNECIHDVVLCLFAVAFGNEASYNKLAFGIKLCSELQLLCYTTLPMSHQDTTSSWNIFVKDIGTIYFPIYDYNYKVMFKTLKLLE